MVVVIGFILFTEGSFEQLGNLPKCIKKRLRESDNS